MSFLDRYTTTTTRGTALNMPKLIFHAVIALVLVFAVLAFNPFKQVPTGSRGIVTQFGKIIGIAEEGLSVLPPWQKLSLMNVRASQVDIEKADGATSDTQPVHVSLTVRYSVFPNKVAEVYEKYNHTGDLSSYIDTAAHEVFKAVTAKYTATNLIAKRAAVSAEINTALKAKVAQYGAQIISIDMRNFTFSEDYMKAIAAKVTQEQLLLGAEKRLLTVIAEQKQKEEVAKADAAAVRANADGSAYATLKNAQASADAIKVQANALAAYGKDVLELRRIEVDMVRARKWQGNVPTTMLAGVPIPYVNVPAH